MIDLARKRIAIVGTGIAGLGCAHFLHRRHDLTLFEANSRVGGHSHTITVPEGDQKVSLDTGFMVYNEVTYPHLTRLFKELGVATEPTSMSFSVHHGPSGVEWNGSGLNTLFGQRRNLLNLRHWRFLFQLNRFNRESVAALNEARWEKMSLGEYVESRGYGQDFFDRYLAPMASAVWSTPPDLIADFPALTLLRFWHNHGFLGLDTQHPWRTVTGGSRSYVEKLTEPFQDRILLETPVRGIERKPGQGVVVISDREEEAFDAVIIAAHGDQAFQMLLDRTPLETDLLQHFRYQGNQVDVHTDPRFMPGKRRCWASWNYRSTVNGAGHTETTTHYWMNSLQGVSDRENYFVSLNARGKVPQEAVKRRLEYEHPLFDLAAREAQWRLPELNAAGADSRTYYCGSYFRYGFHEDALLSSVNLCGQLLGGDPWMLR